MRPLAHCASPLALRQLVLIGGALHEDFLSTGAEDKNKCVTAPPTPPPCCQLSPPPTGASHPIAQMFAVFLGVMRRSLQSSWRAMSTNTAPRSNSTHPAVNYWPSGCSWSTAPPAGQCGDRLQLVPTWTPAGPRRYYHSKCCATVVEATCNNLPPVAT